ncbi:MAG: GspG family T2SS major pseudopilin variant XcpT [Planctomycetota bacterium]
MKSRQAGFSLIELMVVVTIIAILAVVVVSQFGGYSDKAKVATAKGQISQYASSLEMYKLDTGRYPSSSEGLKVLEEKPSGVERWRGPYAEVLDDPWGNPYEYTYDPSTKRFDIISYGADGAPGGTDFDADIKFSEKKEWSK